MTSSNKRGNSTRKSSSRSTSNRSRTSSSKTRRVQRQEEELDYSLRSEITVIAVVAVTVFLFLCNFHLCGSFGDALSGILFGLFGITAYIAPLVALGAVVIGIANFGSTASIRKIVSGIVLFFLVGMLAELLSMRPQNAISYSISTIFKDAGSARNGGGVFAGTLAYVCYKYLSLVGTILLILVAGIASLVVFTQHSFVGGIKNGGRRLIERTREDAANYREYAERRREQMEERRARIEEERRLAIEQKEDEKILRMEKKVSGVMLDTSLEKEKKEEKPRLRFLQQPQSEPETKTKTPTQTQPQLQTDPGFKALSEPDVHVNSVSKDNMNIFIPDENISDDIHEIVLNDRNVETDEAPDEQRILRTTPSIHGIGYDEDDELANKLAANRKRAEEMLMGSTGSSDEDVEDSIQSFTIPENNSFEDEYTDELSDSNSYNEENVEDEDLPFDENLSYDEESEYAEDSQYEEDAEQSFEEKFEDEPLSEDGTDTSLNRLLARVAPEADADNDDILPDVPVHAEHIGNGLNGDYVIHAQDHISRSQDAPSKISSSSPSGSSQSVNLGPGPHTTSPGMEREIEKHRQAVQKKYIYPPLNLLDRGTRNKNPDSARQLKETALKLQETLKTFGVSVTVTDISQGPSVTRFELQPDAGVRVNKIVGLADDIKMNLAARDIRIEAPIPGKAAVGIEVPNKENQPVALRDLLESNEFQEFDSTLAFAVGKDIAGKTVVTDIGKMPHLLIAGATGSGKSVCINTIIMSLIYKAKPEEVQMIMIDPKIVELSVYNGIPHLMIPVVTDPKKAAAALNWAVAEMTNRYKKFAESGVRDLKGYNKLAAASSDESMKVLPRIVVIVDELADLMMVSANEVEDAICRLTQLARAAGIHLIIATQRPSVDVITGLIKANMPSRVAFAVSSGVDSRTILDINGAEKLLGKGDMLFYPQGYTKPARVQGAFVSDKEVQDVTDFLRNQGIDSSYGEEIEQQISSMQGQNGSGGFGSSDSGSDRDEYFVQAGNIIIEKEKASIGMLQRAFKIGFNRAARIMDQLCEAGVVGDEEGTKPRKVLMTKQQFEAYLNGDTEE
ncbi:MAG: DNA translocase FtsK 4TM domain-containing protein [Butyrivibrio sp.]|nr:DNA translocase FtsK 4TM domain-containing protein [Butyrivibrio sp.]